MITSQRRFLDEQHLFDPALPGNFNLEDHD
jgi:hypothetical protein